jgi:diacylglycerol kinase family enzyme
MPGIGVILNPYSRANRKRPERVKHLGFIVGDRGSCHATETLDQVRELAHQFQSQGIEILGLSGGDGTNHQTLSAFIEVYGDRPLPKVAFLRGGTMNNLANQLGIRGTPERVLSQIIIAYHEGGSIREVPVDMVQVNGCYGFFFGMGVITKFIDIFSNVDDKPSPARAAWLLSRAVGSAMVGGRFSRELCERFDAKLTVDGEVQPFRNYTMIFSGTVQSLGFGFRPLYRANTIPGQFQTVAISATARQLFTSFPSALLARPSKSENYIDKMGSQVVLEFERPMRYIVDGDFPEAGTRRIEIKRGPRLTCLVA